MYCYPFGTVPPLTQLFHLFYGILSGGIRPKYSHAGPHTPEQPEPNRQVEIEQPALQGGGAQPPPSRGLDEMLDGPQGPGGAGAGGDGLRRRRAVLAGAGD